MFVICKFSTKSHFRTNQDFLVILSELKVLLTCQDNPYVVQGSKQIKIWHRDLNFINPKEIKKWGGVHIFLTIQCGKK